MVISQKANVTCNIYVKSKKLRQRETFRYLGTLITQDGRNGVEISSQIAQAKTTFQKLKLFLTNNNITLKTRQKAIQCYIKPILMYRCEAWKIYKQADSEKIGGGRNVVPEKTNEMVLKEAETNRSLVQKIRKQQAAFFHHVMRREILEHFLTTGKLHRKRSKGRQREKCWTA